MGSGQSVTWSTNTPSLSGDGRLVVLSDPIEGINADRFFKAMRHFLLTREPIQYEKAYVAKEQADGTILTTISYDGGELLAGKLCDTYTVVHFNLDKDEIVAINYGHDQTLTESEKHTTSTTKIHRDPFRIEFYMQQHAGRHASYTLLGALKDILNRMGTSAEVRMGVESPAGGGLKSVLSDPIEDCEVTAELYVDWSKDQCIEAAGGTLHEDGSVTVQSTSWFVGNAYRRIIFDKEKAEVVSTEFGADSTMTDVESVVHTKVHSRPFRLEMWADVSAKQRAGDMVKDIIDGLVTPVLAKLAEEG